MNTDMDIDINTMTDTITCRLVEARADLGITQKELASATGISLKTIANIESKQHIPSLLQQMAGAWSAKRNGNKLILWTCRAGEALSNAVEWCREQNLEFDAVNDNLPEIIEFYGHNSRKISCDYYIDDRMLLPENAKA